MALGDIEETDDAAGLFPFRLCVRGGDGLTGRAPRGAGGLDSPAVEPGQGYPGGQLVRVDEPPDERDRVGATRLCEGLQHHVLRWDIAERIGLEPLLCDGGRTVESFSFVHVPDSPVRELGLASGG